MPLRNYGAVKGHLTGIEHISYNHGTGKPAHLIFYLQTLDGEKECSFNVFSNNETEVFVHLEHDLKGSSNSHLQQLGHFAAQLQDHMLLKDMNQLLDAHCIDFFEQEIGFPSRFTQEDSKRIIQELNELFTTELHTLHSTTGRQSIKGHEVVIFGQIYDDKKGIHQVHMNSYHAGTYTVAHSDHRWEGGVRQDGALLVNTGVDGASGAHWKAIFVAFDVQVKQFAETPHDHHKDFHASYHASGEHARRTTSPPPAQPHSGQSHGPPAPHPAQSPSGQSHGPPAPHPAQPQSAWSHGPPAPHPH